MRTAAVKEWDYQHHQTVLADLMIDLAFYAHQAGAPERLARHIDVVMNHNEIVLEDPSRDYGRLINHNEIVLKDSLISFNHNETVLGEAVTASNRVLGGRHLELATTLNNLALTRKMQGYASEAATLFGRAIMILQKAVEPSHPLLTTCSENYMALLEEMSLQQAS